MIEFKQKVQLGNRISIPIQIVQSLGITIGDDVTIFCDEQQKMLYIQFHAKPIIFDRGTGTIITREKYQPFTDTKFKPITESPSKKITNPELIEEI